MWMKNVEKTEKGPECTALSSGLLVSGFAKPAEPASAFRRTPLPVRAHLRVRVSRAHRRLMAGTCFAQKRQEA